MAQKTSQKLSINQLVQPRVEELVARADDFRIACQRSTGGALLIDAGIDVVGGIEAGRQIAEICLGGLGHVTISNDGVSARWPMTLNVHTTHPILACLASQYAGWSLSHGEGKAAFHALGSGPGRAISCKEPLFEELGYRDKARTCTLILEVDQLPPDAVIDYVAKSCQMQAEQLNFILTPTRSLAGSFQVVARVLEVALHKAHTLGFPLDAIIDGVGSAPFAPPAPDFVTGMGRTNDAILFAGQVHLFVMGEVAAAQDLANQLPSSTSKDYGKPFAQVFKDHACDFFKIDPLLFSPAKVAVTHLPTGQTFHAGAIDESLLNQSFSG